MTAPSSLSALPAVPRASASRSTSAGSRDGAPAFAHALDDALGSDRSPARGTDRPDRRGADRAADRASDRAVQHAGDRSAVRRTGAADPSAAPDAETPAEQDDATPDTGAAPVVVAPGLWALLAAATAPPAPGSDPAAAALGPVADVATGLTATGLTAAGLGTDPLPAPGAGTAGDPVAVPAPVAGSPLPIAGPATATVAELAAATGLTVVLGEGPAPTPVTTPAATPPAAAPPTTPAPPTAPATDAVPAPGLVGAPPAAVPGDTADSGGDGATGGGAGLPAAVESTPAAETDAVLPLPGAAPAAPAAPAAAAVPATTPTGPDAPVAAQLGRQIAVLHNAPDGSHTMTVVITPESLGPVTVAVTVTDGTLDVTLHGAHDVGRHALQDALPELRRELESAGLSFTKLEVDTSTRDDGSRTAQQLSDPRAGQQGSSGRSDQPVPRPRTWGSAPDRVAEGSAAPTTDQSAPSGVDVRV